MDLNYMLSRHQISLMRAVAAGCIEARVAHESMARGYAVEIDRYHRDRRSRGSAPRKLAAAALKIVRRT